MKFITSVLSSLLKGILIFVGVMILLFALLAWAWPSPAERQEAVNNLHQDTARNFEQQYQAVKESGSPIDACVRAGFVAEAYLQGNDTANYQKWQRIEADDCSAAGVMF